MNKIPSETKEIKKMTLIKIHKVRDLQVNEINSQEFIRTIEKSCTKNKNKNNTNNKEK
jgi:hypothetical protein